MRPAYERKKLTQSYQIMHITSLGRRGGGRGGTPCPRVGRKGDRWWHPCEYVLVLDEAQDLVNYLVLRANSALEMSKGNI